MCKPGSAASWLYDLSKSFCLSVSQFSLLASGDAISTRSLGGKGELNVLTSVWHLEGTP